MDFLMFRLYGPLVSWGDIAVGQERPSSAYPSKSALLGLLAASLGIRRERVEMHQAMAAAYGFAVRVDAPGTLLRDYHTTQVPPQRRNRTYHTRRDELQADTLSTILSSREYRCDALYTIAVWHRTALQAPFTLLQLAASLKQPRFTLYLGRKSCPLALPVQATVITVSDLEVAFATICFQDDADVIQPLEEQAVLDRTQRVLVYWEADDTSVDTGNLRPLHTIVRRDYPLHRQRWQFAPRREHQAHIEYHSEGE